MTTLHILQLLLVASTLGGLTLIALRPRAVWRVVGGFLSHRTYAVSLAVIRILLFARLYTVTSGIQLEPLIQAPAKTRNLPPGWGWLGNLVPLFDIDFANAMRALFLVAVLLAILGAATRFSAPVAALTSVYLVGLPNFFSKINHGHHLLVCFCLILAFSRCADALSVDELVRGARQRRLSLSRNDTRSLAYGLPIRLCWLVLALAYFFPGLYKTWNAGDQWLSGHSLLVIAYQKLATLTEYRPLIIIYDSPGLLAFLGAGTLLFELGFIFLILSRRFWWIAPIVAFGFHCGLAFSIGIIPWGIVHVFWVFVDVGVILYVFRRHIPQRVLDLLGIGGAPPTAQLLTAQPGTAEPATEPARGAEPATAQPATAEPATEPARGAEPATAEPATPEPATESARAEPATESARAEPATESARAEPAIADSSKTRTAASQAAASKASKAAASKTEPSWTVSATAGGTVVALMLFTGLAGIDTFPVAVFPRFDTRRSETADPRPARYMLAIQRGDGEPKEISQKRLPKQARRARWDKTLRNLYQAKGRERQSQYRAIEGLLKQGGQRFKPGDRLSLYREYIQFDPKTHERVVVERKLLSTHAVDSER